MNAENVSSVCVNEKRVKLVSAKFESKLFHVFLMIYSLWKLLDIMSDILTRYFALSTSNETQCISKLNFETAFISKIFNNVMFLRLGIISGKLFIRLIHVLLNISGVLS